MEGVRKTRREERKMESRQRVHTRVEYINREALRKVERGIRGRRERERNRRWCM